MATSIQSLLFRNFLATKCNGFQLSCKPKLAIILHFLLEKHKTKNRMPDESQNSISLTRLLKNSFPCLHNTFQLLVTWRTKISIDFPSVISRGQDRVYQGMCSVHRRQHVFILSLTENFTIKITGCYMIENLTGTFFFCKQIIQTWSEERPTSVEFQYGEF